MARLLLVGFTLTLGMTLFGCQLPNWLPQIRGTVLDKRSGTPVVGAEVFATWNEIGSDGHLPIATLWATTDEQGQFVLPLLTSERFGILRYGSEYPEYLVVHRDYGYGGEERLVNDREFDSALAYYSPVIEIEPDPLTVKTLQDPRAWPWLCRHVTAAACYHACESLYGTRKVCR